MRKVTPHDVYSAIYKELETTATIKCIAELENSWYNVTFDNGEDSEELAVNGISLHDTLVQCERTNIQNSAVVYIKAPFEMTDQVVTTALTMYGTVENIRRQMHDFDSKIETGVRSCLIKNLKKPIPSFIKVGGFSLPVRYRGQEKTCKICVATGHIARECPRRGRCFVCGSLNHRASWHDEDHKDTDSEDQEVVIRIPPVKVWADPDNKEANYNDADNEENVRSKKDQKTTKQSINHQPQQIGFWDEAVRAKTMKRKSPEENKETSPNNKISRDDRYEEESDMEHENIPYPEQKDTPPEHQARQQEDTRRPEHLITTKRQEEHHITPKRQQEHHITPKRQQEDIRQPEKKKASETRTEKTHDTSRNIHKLQGGNEDRRSVEDDSAGDGEETDQEGFVLYTRGGVQRSRKKRTSWQRKTTDTQPDTQPNSQPDSQPSTSKQQQQDELSQSSQPSQSTQRTRGRGKTIEKE